MPALRRSSAYDAGRRHGRDVARERILDVIEQHAAFDYLHGDQPTARRIEAAIDAAAAQAAEAALNAVEDGAERVGFLCDLCWRVQQGSGKCPDCLGSAHRLVVAWEPVS